MKEPTGTDRSIQTWTATSLTMGALVGMGVGAVIAGGPGISVGIAVGTAVGLLVGAVAQEMYRRGHPTPTHHA